MIFSSIISVLSGFIVIIFNAIPYSIPAMPDVITTGLSFITTPLSSVVHLLSYMYTPVFFIALCVIAIAIITFDQLYAVFMWIIRKIPALGIN